METKQYETDNFVRALHLEYHHVNPVGKLCYFKTCPVKGRVLSRKEAVKLSVQLPRDLQNRKKM